jgi:hypothetical protein
MNGEAVTYVDIWCNSGRGFEASAPAAEYQREAARRFAVDPFAI